MDQNTFRFINVLFHYWIFAWEIPNHNINKILGQGPFSHTFLFTQLSKLSCFELYFKGYSVVNETHEMTLLVTVFVVDQSCCRSSTAAAWGCWWRPPWTPGWSSHRSQGSDWSSGNLGGEENIATSWHYRANCNINSK